MAVPLLLWLISSCTKLTRDIYFNNSSVVCSLLLRAGIYNPSPQEYFVSISLKTPIGNIPAWILHSVLMLRRNVSKPCGWVSAQLSTSPWGINHPVYLVLMLDNDYTSSFPEEQQPASRLPSISSRGGTQRDVRRGGTPPWFLSRAMLQGGRAAPPRMPCPSPEPSCPTPWFFGCVSCCLHGPGSPRREGATGNVVGEILRVGLGTEISLKPQPSSLPSLAGRELGGTPYFGA